MSKVTKPKAGVKNIINYQDGISQKRRYSLISDLKPFKVIADKNSPHRLG